MSELNTKQKESINIFKALSDKNRLRILKMLKIKPLCVCEITDVLQLACRFYPGGVPSPDFIREKIIKK